MPSSSFHGSGAILKYCLILWVLFPLVAMADKGAIVKCVQTDGTVIYTNKKCESGKTEKISLKKNNAGPSAVSAEFAFVSQESNIEVTGKGEVMQLLADDKAGGRHQRFILKLESGHTLLIAHNIDLAPRIEILRTGDIVEFYGEYLWNETGGLLHWTHRDPQGKHVPGWLLHNGKRYQ